MPTLHARIVLSEEGREVLQHLQPGEHLNVTFEIAPTEYALPPHGPAHEIPVTHEQEKRDTFSAHHPPHKG